MLSVPTARIDPKPVMCSGTVLSAVMQRDGIPMLRRPSGRTADTQGDRIPTFICVYLGRKVGGGRRSEGDKDSRDTERRVPFLGFFLSVNFSENRRSSGVRSPLIPVLTTAVNLRANAAFGLRSHQETSAEAASSATSGDKKFLFV